MNTVRWRSFKSEQFINMSEKFQFSVHLLLFDYCSTTALWKRVTILGTVSVLLVNTLLRRRLDPPCNLMMGLHQDKRKQPPNPRTNLMEYLFCGLRDVFANLLSWTTSGFCLYLFFNTHWGWILQNPTNRGTPLILYCPDEDPASNYILVRNVNAITCRPANSRLNYI